jgi:Transposase DDE domain
VLVFGKANFTNMSRYSDKSERTYRRQYSKDFNFTGLNAEVIQAATALAQVLICVMDCSFIQKSGKQTPGLDWFYNGSASRTERGLEISLLAIVDVNARRGYSLSVRQTSAKPKSNAALPKPSGGGRRQILSKTISDVSQYFKALLLEPKPTASNPEGDQPEQTRIDCYLAQFNACVELLPKAVKYVVVDGFYSKIKFVDGVVSTKHHVISKLRIDANLRYLYTGPQKSRGAKRKYDGKVDLSDLSRFMDLGELEANLHLYTACVWHVTLKRQIRLVCLVDQRRPGKRGVALLFSTDIELDANTLLTYYQARFQIEFIFRDAKQFTGLYDAQTRKLERLDYHFNASLTALNLAKYEDQLQQSNPQEPSEPFSMSSIKRRAFNTYLLEQFIAMLGLDPTCIKSSPNFEELCSLGIIGP